MENYKAALKQYRVASGCEYARPCKAKSYTRNDATHLLSKEGALLAVVHPDGNVTYGAALLAWQRQFLAGMPAPMKRR